MNKLLIIDSHTGIRLNLIELLSLEGFEVMSAENGLLGLQLARECQPDLIICDLVLPDLNGFEILRQLRTDLATVEIPFIFHTAISDSYIEGKAFQLGADGYLKKPVGIGYLLKVITAQLRKKISPINL
jgi:DNA-binding response OmpR family regulator